MYSRGVTRLSDTTQIYDNPTSHVFPPHNDIKHPGRKRRTTMYMNVYSFTEVCAGMPVGGLLPSSC